MTTPSVPAGDSGASERRYPMSDAAFRRLTDEAGRLSDMARGRNVGEPNGEAPDAAAVAASIWEADAIGRRLDAIRAAMAAAEIAEAPGEVVIGRSVRIRDDGGADTFRLVIPGAGDPANGAISIDSPLGGALVGSRSGDRVEYATPAGVRTAVVEAVGEEDVTPF